MTFYIKLSAYLMNIYLLGFSHEATLGTPGYIRKNTFRICFMVPCQKPRVVYQHLARGEGTC